MNVIEQDTAAVTLLIPGHAASLQLYVHGEHDRFVSRQIRETGSWEPYETSLLMAMLGRDSVFLDVGANIGYFSILAASVVGQGGRVFAFEPDPSNLALFAASCEINSFTSRIHTFAGGLSDRADSARLYLSEDNMGDHQIYAGAIERDSIPIELVNGSDYLQGRLGRLDLIKIDTQGSEYAVVCGLMQLLQSLSRPPRIIIELTPFSLREAGASGRQLIELLGTLGLPFWIIDHIEHRLVASTAQDLALWCDNVDACEGDQGFMNILVGAGLGDSPAEA
ncbi:MAG: FkbM family methyltransferase [Halioglobus sp.]